MTGHLFHAVVTNELTGLLLGEKFAVTHFIVINCWCNFWKPRLRSFSFGTSS